jgi:3-methyladenine DNA glycosylase/8-oxoguanine DNA glycosylase
MLINSSDEELIEKLVAVRGLGRWSVGTYFVRPENNVFPFYFTAILGITALR